MSGRPAPTEEGTLIIFMLGLGRSLAHLVQRSWLTSRATKSVAADYLREADSAIKAVRQLEVAGPKDMKVFRNRLKLLRAIDQPELEEAGLKLLRADWEKFRAHPIGVFELMPDEQALKVWAVIETRETRR